MPLSRVVYEVINGSSSHQKPLLQPKHLVISKTSYSLVYFPTVKIIPLMEYNGNIFLKNKLNYIVKNNNKVFDPHKNWSYILLCSLNVH